MMNTTFSYDRKYRYVLTREFMFGSRGAILFVLLNPSTADENKNDPTIRRCIDFSKLWGFRSMMIGELFAIRSIDPHVLLRHHDPVGPSNDHFLQIMAQEADLVVCAWGNWGKVRGRSVMVAELLKEFKPKMFGLTKEGEPLHPLYQAKKNVLVDF